jgi:hypothetical protein
MFRAAGIMLLILMLTGCARPGPWPYTESAGVPASLRLADGSRVSGMLLSYEPGVLVLDCEVTRSEDLTVVRRDGRDMVLLSGVPVGTAVEIRDFDVVVRRSFPRGAVESVSLVRPAHVGWGTPVAAVLGFLLFQLLEDL